MSEYVNKDGEKKTANTATKEIYPFTVGDIIGESEKIRGVRHRIEKVARTNSSVLIYGETGTGKDMIAQAIHNGSARQDRPFVSRNCAAIPSNLVESIFFGTARGSYTGAEDRMGILEAADGGTIFLDEINSMNVDMQAKLLKVLEYKRIIRVGETKSRKLDIRILCALNESPRKCIQEKTIRSDLYYRLASVQIKSPSLRERRSDIPLLIEHFIRIYNREMGRQIRGLSQEAREILAGYDWPGNVRELKNAVEGAFNMAEGELIRGEDLPEYISENFEAERNASTGAGHLPDLSLQDYMNTCESVYIREKMKNYDSLAGLAEFLGVSKQTLNYKLKKYGLGGEKVKTGNNR